MSAKVMSRLYIQYVFAHDEEKKSLKEALYLWWTLHEGARNWFKRAAADSPSVSDLYISFQLRGTR